MFRKATITLATAAVLALGAPSAASAAVTFDSTTGHGFVGKGDVQIPFGWNDAKLQSNASGVTFKYQSVSDDTYAVTCEWDTGNRNIVHHIQRKSADVIASVAYDVSKIDRKNPNGKVTGFHLTGKSNAVVQSEGRVPVEGGGCPENNGQGVEKVITNVELVSSDASESLTALHVGLGLSAVIWPPVVAPTV